MSILGQVGRYTLKEYVTYSGLFEGVPEPVFGKVAPRAVVKMPVRAEYGTRGGV
jgi:hypothetical protein